jgi:hypothetical protein
MTRKAVVPSVGPVITTSILITEDPDEFERRREAFIAEIAPRGYIERMYAEDFSDACWEIRRIKRSKTSVLNLAFKKALHGVLCELIKAPANFLDDLKVSFEAQSLADSWFSSEKAKAEVRALLAKFLIDESAVEARALVDASRQYKEMDRLLSDLERRRDNALAQLARYRRDRSKILEAEVKHFSEPSNSEPSDIAAG